MKTISDLKEGQILKIKHKLEDRETNWSWKRLKNGLVRATITSYLNGYYSATTSFEKDMPIEDFFQNVLAVQNLSTLEVKVL